MLQAVRAHEGNWPGQWQCSSVEIRLGKTVSVIPEHVSCPRVHATRAVHRSGTSTRYQTKSAKQYYTVLDCPRILVV